MVKSVLKIERAFSAEYVCELYRKISVFYPFLPDFYIMMEMYARKWSLPLCVYSVVQSYYITVGPTRVCVKMLNRGVAYSWGMPPFHADITFFLHSWFIVFNIYGSYYIPIIHFFSSLCWEKVHTQNLLHFFQGIFIELLVTIICSFPFRFESNKNGAPQRYYYETLNNLSERFSHRLYEI